MLRSLVVAALATMVPSTTVHAEYVFGCKASEGETCVLLNNETDSTLSLSIDEKYQCDAPEHSVCLAEHVKIGRHTLKVTRPAGPGAIYKTADVGPDPFVLTITQ